jgi:excisionase family DNA binding protein
MSSQFLSLEEAAKKLGVTTDQLVAFRSEGKIRGFRDGASWKFPENELQRLADDLASSSGDYDPYRLAGLDDDFDPADHPSAGGSGVLVDDLDLGSAISTGGSSRLGSDVNLVAGDGEGSDVKVVTSSDEDSDFTLKGRREGLVELDSADLQLSSSEPALTHDSEMLDLAIDPKTGSTGPISRKDPDADKGDRRGDSGLSFNADDEDSDDDMLGLSEDDMLGGSPASKSSAGGLSSLELMDDLDISSGSSGVGRPGGRSNDVLGELDLLSVEGGGSGLITGDSGNVIGGGSSVAGGSSGRGSGLAIDDDDDELLITDDEDDLVLGGSDLSVAGDSGINLMSPSDSGISLESEPLDLAGSSISALDLGAEIGSGIGLGSSGRGVGGGSGPGGEDFQLSPSGIGLDADSDSSSQVIEVEDSAAFAQGDPDLLGDGGFGDPLDADDAFAQEEGGFGDEDALAVEDGFAEERPGPRAGAYPAAYEVPYSVFQVVGLVCIVTVMSLGGMLMSDLVRNMWTYSEPAAPVSGLTDWLIDISPFGS